MLKQTPGIIYIESQRGNVPESGGETFCSFNYRNFINKDKTPVPPLQYFNETILRPGGKAVLDIAGSSCFIIPVYNSLEVNAENQQVSLHPGEALLLENHIEGLCINPEKTENASFVWFTVDKGFHSMENDSFFQKILLPIDKIKNQWIDLFTGNIKIKIVCMDAREELEYTPVASGNRRLFFFNITGCFEVCGRLLNQNDGLVLWDCNEVDVEALNPGSIILLLEL